MPTAKVYLDRGVDSAVVTVENVDFIELRDNGQLFFYRGEEPDDSLCSAFSSHAFTHFVIEED